MRRKLALILGGLALGALAARLFRRRRGGRDGELAPMPAAEDPRAVALRRELDRARERPSGEPAADEAPPGVDDARRRVHRRGRAAVETMRRAGGATGEGP